MRTLKIPKKLTNICMMISLIYACITNLQLMMTGPTGFLPLQESTREYYKLIKHLMVEKLSIYKGGNDSVVRMSE